jgi:hypothetical protein
MEKAIIPLAIYFTLSGSFKASIQKVERPLPTPYYHQ